MSEKLTGTSGSCNHSSSELLAAPSPGCHSSVSVFRLFRRELAGPLPLGNLVLPGILSPCWRRRCDNGVGEGTPGNFLGEYTVKGSVKTCASTVELSDRTYEAPGSGAGGPPTLTSRIRSLNTPSVLTERSWKRKKMPGSSLSSLSVCAPAAKGPINVLAYSAGSSACHGWGWEFR